MEPLSKPLMDRIKITDFLSLSINEQRDKIVAIQALRSDSIIEARTKLAGTRSAAKNRAKRGKSTTSSDKTKLKKLLAKMTPEQLAAFKASYGL